LATATIIDQTDPPLLKRARRYEREALQDLFDRNVDRVYAIASALNGDPRDAEQHTRNVFRHILEHLDNFGGDAREFEAWACRLAATEAPPRTTPDVLRRAYRNLDPGLREIVSLRVMTGLEAGRVSHVLHLSDHEMLSGLVRALRTIAGAPGRGSSPVDLTPFDNALTRVQRGDTPEGAAQTVSAPPDAHLLLATAAHCIALAGGGLDTATQRRLRAAFLADAGERRARWVQQHRTTPGVAGVIVRRGTSHLTSGAFLAFFIILAIVVGAVLGMVSMFSDPDSPFYSAKLTAENMLLAVQISPSSKSNLQVELAATRLSEAEDMAYAGKGTLTVQAMQRRYTLLEDAANELAGDFNHDAKWESAVSTWESASAISAENIENDLRAANQPAAATQVANLATTFQAQRKVYIQQLSGKPHPGNLPSPKPTG
jgi:DNA-directed RNA polymerase specialized sigma24 family protein